MGIQTLKSLDMTGILGYPRKMPPRYEKWLPKFTGNDVVGVEDHMSNFWVFFQLRPISDGVEDLAMKLFFATHYDGTRRWYNGLPLYLTFHMQSSNFMQQMDVEDQSMGLTP
jgi:hypothetical protein